jgi:hypothetical protein
MAGFRGYNEEDFKVGIRPSTIWRDLSEIVRSDFKKLQMYEVPTFADTSKKVEVKHIGTTKRNSIQEISARGADFTFRQLVTENYMNACADVIETSLGKIIKRVDGSGNFYEVGVASYGIEIKDTVYTDGGDIPAGYNPFYIRFKKNGRIVCEAERVLSAAATKAEVMTDLLTALGTSDANDYLTIVDGTDGTGTIAVTDEGNAQFDSYEISDNLAVGCKINLDADISTLLGADFVNDKTIIPCVIKDGATDEILDIIYITRKISNTSVQCAGSVFKTAFNSDFSSVVLQAMAFIDMDENQSYLADYMFVRSAAYNPDEDNEFKAEGAKCLSLINTLGSAKIELPVQDKPMIEVMVKADSYEYTKPMNDDNLDATDEWKEATREGSILESLSTFPASQAGSATPTWLMTYGANGAATAPQAGDTHFGVYINGEEFKVAKGSIATIKLILDALALVINADTRYTATVTVGDVSNPAKLTITSVDKSKKLHCLGFVLGTGTVTATTSTETIEANAVAYSEVAKTVKFDKFLIGTTMCNLSDFCEVGKLTLDITREVVEIPSICGEQGRKGWDNSTYSIYVTVETTDIQATRVYDKWAKYIGNQDFILMAVDTESGLGFLFPKCRFEDHNQQAMNNLQGHSYKINVNYDPEKKFVLMLPQTIIQ